MMNTCKTCKHFTKKNSKYGLPKYGECALMIDSNDVNKKTAKSNRCYGLDYQGYSAGVYVGEDFGCIHWEKK